MGVGIFFSIPFFFSLSLSLGEVPHDDWDLKHWLTIMVLIRLHGYADWIAPFD